MAARLARAAVELVEIGATHVAEAVSLMGLVRIREAVGLVSVQEESDAHVVAEAVRLLVARVVEGEVDMRQNTIEESLPKHIADLVYWQLVRSLSVDGNRLPADIYPDTKAARYEVNTARLALIRKYNYEIWPLRAVDNGMSFQLDGLGWSPSYIFEQFEQAKKESGRFLKLAHGEKRTLQFNPSKIAIPL